MDEANAKSVENNLRLSIWEGASYSAMAGSIEGFFIPLLLALGGLQYQVGLLVAAMHLFLGFSQFAGLWLVETFKRRKKIMVVGGIAHVLVILLMFLGVLTGWMTSWLFILLCGGYFATVGVTIPSWASFMGDMTTDDTRGSYFGKRNSICHSVFFVFMLGAGGLLEHFKSSGKEFFGFAVIIMLAFLGRSASTWVYTFIRDFPYERLKEAYFSFWEFLSKSGKSNFTRFVFFIALMNLSMTIAGPYFAAYMLQDLEFSYIQFTAAIASFFIAMIIATRRFGPLADKYGNRVILIISGVMTPIFPLLWFFSTNFYYILLLQALNGIILAGWFFAGLNFLLDAVSAPKRARCTAYYQFTNSMGVCTGALLGAFLSARAETIVNGIAPDAHLFSPLYLIFLISSILSVIVLIFFLPKFREVRDVKDPNMREMLAMFVHFRPFTGIRFRFNPVVHPRKLPPKKEDNSSVDL